MIAERLELTVMIRLYGSSKHRFCHYINAEMNGIVSRDGARHGLGGFSPQNWLDPRINS